MLRALLGGLAVVALALPAAAGDNPTLPPGCGVDVGIMVDTSRSVIDEGREVHDQVRQASADLVRSLAGTPSSVTAWRFAGEPEAVARRLRMDDSDQVEAAVAALRHLHFDDTLIRPGTYWDAALLAVENVALDVLVLVTDGSPMGSGRHWDEHRPALDEEFDAAALRAAVRVADRIKAKGTRIVAVGVGDVAEDGLRAITGPDRGSDWFVGDFESLGASLGKVAGALCGGGIVTRVLVDGVEHRVPDVTITPFPQGRRPGPVVRDVPPGRYVVSARPPAGALLSAADCDVDGVPRVIPVDYADGTAEVEIGERQVASCTFSYASLATLGERARTTCARPVPAAVPLVAAFVALLVAAVRYAARPAWSGPAASRAGAAVTGVAAVVAILALGVGGFTCGWSAARPGLLGLVLATVAYGLGVLAGRTTAEDAPRTVPWRRVGLTAAALTVLGGIVAVGALVARDDGPRALRVDGRVVDNAGDALVGLERFVAGQVVAAGGDPSTAPRCYFVRQDGGELDDAAVCGPVQRPDDPAPSWDRYAVRLLPRGDGRAYLHVDRANPTAAEPPASGLIRPGDERDSTPPPLPTPTPIGSPPPTRVPPGAVVRATVEAPLTPAGGQTVDFGSGATVSLRAWWVDDVDTDGVTRTASPGERLLALDVERPDVATGAALRIVDGDRRLDLPPPQAFDSTIVVSVRYADRAQVRVGLQGVEVPLTLPTLDPAGALPQPSLTAFTSLARTIPGGEVPVRESPLPGLLPAKQSLSPFVLRGVELTTRHPRTGWSDEGRAWLVAKVDDLSPPCPFVAKTRICEIQLADSFAVRDLDGRVHPAVWHARTDLAEFTGVVDVVFAVPADLREPTLVVRPTFVWEIGGKQPERLAFPRREMALRLAPRTADQVLAESMALSAHDLPGSWRTRPYARPPEVDSTQEELERCLGRPGMQARETGRARSPFFHAHDRDERQLWAAVSLQRSAEENLADLRALQGDRGTRCLRDVFTATLEAEGTLPSEDGLTFVPRELAGLDVPYVAFRATILPADGDLPAFHADLVSVVVDRVTIEFSALDTREPVPDDVQLAALRAVIERARSAAPAASPTPTGGG